MSQVTETANENRSPMDEDPGSQFYLTSKRGNHSLNLSGAPADIALIDVTIEWVDELADSDEELWADIADLWVLDAGDLADGKCYPLVRGRSRRWEVKGAINLPKGIHEIRCEVHCPSGHAHFVVDADCSGVEFQGPKFEAGFRENIETDGEGHSLVISWEFAKEWESGISGAGDGLAAHINACSCDECISTLSYTPRAIETLQSALKLTPAGHPSIVRCYINLAGEHARAFRLDQDISHVDGACSAFSNALDLTPRSDSDYPNHLERLGMLLMLRFDLTEDFSYLDNAISKRREAVEATPEEDLKFSCRNNCLGRSLYLRFEHKGSISDLSDAINAQAKALEARLRRHIYLKSLAQELGSSIQSFVQRIDALIRDTKSLSSEGVGEGVCPPSCGCDIPRLLHNLGCLLHLRFIHASATSDIDTAISVRRLLVFLTPGTHPDYSTFLDDLGSSLQSRFQRYGSFSDIDEAISLFQKSASGQIHPGCHTGQLEDGRRCTTHSIASCFHDRYEVTRDCKDLDEAISTLQRMVFIDPGDLAHPCVAAWLHSLATFFGAHFEHTRDPRDLAEAVSIQERLLQRPDNQDSNGIISGDVVILSNMLNNRSVEYGSLEDIDRAISLGRRMIRLTHEDSVELPRRLEALGSLLRNRVQRHVASTTVTGLAVYSPERLTREEPSSDLPDSLALQYLTEAIGLLRKAVELTPSDVPNLPARLDNLAACLHARFDESRDLCDIQEALALQVRAIKLAPDHHAARKSTYMAALAEMYHCLHAQTGSDEHQADLLNAWESVSSSPFLPPQQRLEAAVRFARHCDDTTKVTPAFDSAIKIATLMVGLDQTVAQRHSHIRGFSEMPLEAAAIACHSGRPDKAVEWLEQGRCLVWSQLNRLRTPLENLRECNPELATEISKVSKGLEEAGSRRAPIDFYMSEPDKLALDDEARAHAKLARRWEDLLVKARAIDGFESFLKPAPCSALVGHVPATGNIVIVTAHKRRCDAIALIAGLGEPLLIPLPDPTISKARMYRAILGKRLSALGIWSRVEGEGESDKDEGNTAERGAGRYRAKDRNVLYVRKALWIEVVKPILNALAIPKADDPSVSTLHRIWWCPMGALSFLPLHAAGMYSDAGSESVLDYVVSSYTPSISSLLERVKDDRRTDEMVSGLFLTNQPKVRGYQRIAGTTKEVNSVHQIATERGIRVLKVEGSELSVDDCLKHMEEYSSVHFACHGYQNADEPLQSQLRLETGALELGAIMQKNLKNADLAFLSACQTSMGEEKLDNEAVHLAAGMLAAGYRRVVATMWEIRDSHATDVANDFCRYLWDHQEEGSGSSFDGSLSAHALHHAVRQLRERLDADREVRGLSEDLEKSLLTWIPYVHFGY